MARCRLPKRSLNPLAIADLFSIFKTSNNMQKYTLTIPDLTMEEARKIADDAYGSMMWAPSDDGKSLAAYPYKNPVLITPQPDPGSSENAIGEARAESTASIPPSTLQSP